MIINIKLSKKFYLSFCETLFIFYVQLNKKCSVSPGGFTLKHAQKTEKEIEKSTPSPKSFQFQKETIGIKVPEGNEKLHTISVRRYIQ